MNRKMSLETLRIQSFVTVTDDRMIRGGTSGSDLSLNPNINCDPNITDPYGPTRDGTECYPDIPD